MITLPAAPAGDDHAGNRVQKQLKPLQKEAISVFGAQTRETHGLLAYRGWDRAGAGETRAASVAESLEMNEALPAPLDGLSVSGVSRSAA